MKAIILAAGQGTRLKKYTQNLPKGMLMFLGKTIIERQVEFYKACGIKDVIVVKGYAGDQIRYEGLKYYYNSEYATTNMIESLLKAREEFDDDLIISYSDILFDRSMLEGMMKAEGDFVVAVDDDWKSYWKARYGKVDLDTESLTIDTLNNILSIGKENPPMEEIDSRYVGLLKFSKQGAEYILDIMERDYPLYKDKPWKQSGKSIRQAYMTDLLQAIIESGKKVKAKRFQNGWIEFDTNEDYERARDWAKDGTLIRFLKDQFFSV